MTEAFLPYPGTPLWADVAAWHLKDDGEEAPHVVYRVSVFGSPGPGESTGGRQHPVGTVEHRYSAFHRLHEALVVRYQPVLGAFGGAPGSTKIVAAVEGDDDGDRATAASPLPPNVADPLADGEFPAKTWFSYTDDAFCADRAAALTRYLAGVNSNATTRRAPELRLFLLPPATGEGGGHRVPPPLALDLSVSPVNATTLAIVVSGAASFSVAVSFDAVANFADSVWKRYGPFAPDLGPPPPEVTDLKATEEWLRNVAAIPPLAACEEMILLCNPTRETNAFVALTCPYLEARVTFDDETDHPAAGGDSSDARAVDVLARVDVDIGTSAWSVWRSPRHFRRLADLLVSRLGPLAAETEEMPSFRSGLLIAPMAPSDGRDDESEAATADVVSYGERGRLAAVLEDMLAGLARHAVTALTPEMHAFLALGVDDGKSGRPGLPLAVDKVPLKARGSGITVKGLLAGEQETPELQTEAGIAQALIRSGSAVAVFPAVGNEESPDVTHAWHPESSPGDFVGASEVMLSEEFATGSGAVVPSSHARVGDGDANPPQHGSGAEVGDHPGSGALFDDIRDRAFDTVEDATEAHLALKNYLSNENSVLLRSQGAAAGTSTVGNIGRGEVAALEAVLQKYNDGLRREPNAFVLLNNSALILCDLGRAELAGGRTLRAHVCFQSAADNLARARLSRKTRIEIAVNLGILSYYRALAEFQPRLRVACLRTAIAELVDVLCQRKRLYRAYLFVAKASVRLAAERSGAVAQKAFQIALAHMEALAQMDAPSPIWLAHWPPLLRDAFEVLADKLVVGVDDAEGEIFRRQTLFHPLLDELEEVAEAVETIFARVGNAALRHTTQTFFAEWRNFFIVRMQMAALRAEAKAEEVAFWAVQGADVSRLADFVLTPSVTMFVHAGFLYQRSGQRKAWKKRFFVLSRDDPALRIYGVRYKDLSRDKSGAGKAKGRKGRGREADGGSTSTTPSLGGTSRRAVHIPNLVVSIKAEVNESHDYDAIISVTRWSDRKLEQKLRTGPDSCFSINTHTATLDVAARDRATREAWIDALEHRFHRADDGGSGGLAFRYSPYPFFVLED